MSSITTFEIFVVCNPGLEAALRDELKALKFLSPKAVVGGVEMKGRWRDVWRANMEVRGATRVLVRAGTFGAPHLAQLDKRARKFPWGDFLRPDVAVRVEASCKGSRIYHAGAVTQRIETALREDFAATISDDAAVTVMARIEDDLCTISIDTSGEMLHKRGHKEAVGKAPMRETMAALFLRQCGFNGTEPVVDPMCGSGTFVIEAAEIAAGLKPGRARDFAFKYLKSFDAEAFAALPAVPMVRPQFQFYGFDRDAGVVKMCKANATRAGVEDFTQFKQQLIGSLVAPEGPVGLVMVNPPYGTRIGEKKSLYGLYGAFGKTLLTGFSGWRVGMVTSEVSLAQAAGLPFKPVGRSVSHGGLHVYLFQTDVLP